MKYRTFLFSSYILLLVTGCKKDKLTPEQNAEFIKGVFDSTYISYSYKPTTILFLNHANACFDTMNYSTYAEFQISSQSVENIALQLNKIDIRNFNYPHALPYLTGSLDSFGNIFIKKNKNDSQYVYKLSPDANSQIILDAYDAASSILIGRFSGKLYGSVVAEYISPVTDSMLVSNGAFSIALTKD